MGQDKSHTQFPLSVRGNGRCRPLLGQRSAPSGIGGVSGYLLGNLTTVLTNTGMLHGLLVGSWFCPVSEQLFIEYPLCARDCSSHCDSNKSRDKTAHLESTFEQLRFQEQTGCSKGQSTSAFSSVGVWISCFSSKQAAVDTRVVSFLSYTRIPV